MNDTGDNLQPESGSVQERSDPSAERLAEGFAQHVERWARRLQSEGSVQEHGVMPDSVRQAGAAVATRPPTDEDFAILRHAAHQTSLATSNGHVCLMLSELAALSPSPAGGGAPLPPSPPGGGLGWGHARSGLSPSPPKGGLGWGHARSGLSPSPPKGGLGWGHARSGLSPSPPGGGQGWGQPPHYLRDSLLSTRVVGTPDSPGACPLILDPDGRLYLHRYFDYEVRLARRIMQAARTPPRTVTSAARDLLNTLFPPPPDNEVDWQKIAAALALRNTLTIISGGPGTGKTTTVVNLLACLLTQEPHSRIALAAPTGKAAARMTEAIRQRADHLPEHLRDKLPAESFTIHRLLGANPGRGTFTHDAGNPLPYDALIVDEASMLDLALATRLLEAVPASARIILLGDKDQLAAVEAGAVFAELSADPTLTDECRSDVAELCCYKPERIAPPVPAQASPLHDAAVWLTKNYRFPADSGIGRLARYINEGRADEAMALLRESRVARPVASVEAKVVAAPAATKTRSAKKRNEDTASLSLFPEIEPPSAAAAGSSAPAPGHATSIQWLDPEQGDHVLDAILAGYSNCFETVRRDPTDVGAIFRAFNAFRVLCAVREGPSGSNWVNDQVTRRGRQVLPVFEQDQPPDPRSPWYAGRPVMVLRNDYVNKLFNGDIGIALPAGDAVAVLFPDGDNGMRGVPIARMPPHETAFAMTVHKAQGSECDSVLVLLPHQRSRVVARELLYTAVTRARSCVTVAGSADVLAAAIESRSRCHSGLLARLRPLAAPQR